MKRWLATINCFLLFISQLTAQQLIFKTYTEEDGLVSNPVRRIFQDSRGFIWIGTWQGLSKYDGHKFTNYTTVNGLSDNMINDMYESPDGKLYVAENNGTVDVLQHDAILKKDAYRNVLINEFCITKDQRVIAATDTAGLYEIKNRTLVKPRQNFPQSTYDVIAELNDSLLIGGSEGTLRILTKNYDLISEIKEHRDLQFFKLYKDSKNRVWVGTSNGLMFISITRKDSQLPVFSLLPDPYKIPEMNNRVTDMLEDTHGNFWVTTINGLIKIKSDGSWQMFSEKDGLPSEDIRCIYMDKENNIWIGSSLGLTKLVTKNEIRIYTIKQELNPKAVSFLSPLNKDLFLVGTETGPQLFNSNNYRVDLVRSQHNAFYYGYIHNSHPLLFSGYNNRVGIYDSANQFIKDYLLSGTPNSLVYCSLTDSNGIIFSGTQEGLLISSGGKYYRENKFNYRITFLLLDKKGDLWAATWSNGLFRIQYTNTNGKINIFVKDFSQLLPDKNIRCLFEDSKGNLWVGTRHHGVAKLIFDNSGQNSVQTFDLQQELMSNWARTITEDAKGCIWIGSDLGIDKLIPDGDSFRVFNFSRVNNYFDQVNMILPGKDNSLWLATNKGIVNIIDGEMEKTPAGKIYITSVKLGDTSFNYTQYQPGTKVVLKYDQNQAAFEFSAPGFINEKQILYSYRLIGGADTSWSKPANLQNVSYASLQPGDYRFEVRTTGWNTIWGVPESFKFLIRKPYWQTWWFYSLIGLLVILISYTLYRYRIKQILKLQQVRNRIASDLHDDIGSTLTNISILSELSNKNLHQPRQAQEYLQRITEEVNASGQALDDIIWSVNSKNDTLEEMLVRMRRFAAELFDQTSTRCYLELQPDAVGKKLSMEQRRDVYLVYKETLNNIYKHAAAQSVWINLSMIDHSIKLQIRDDGKGFDPEATTNRNGLNNLKTRVEKWKGKLVISSQRGEGSNIEIIMPVAN